MSGIAVLISGTGTNLQAILDACQAGELPGFQARLVVSNRAAAGGMLRAIKHGVPVVYFPLAPYRGLAQGRTAYDAALARLVAAFDVDWVVLAGWMHVLSRAFLERFPNRVINLHPALPDTFPGTEAIERAYEASRSGLIDHTGVMVHLVPDEGVDCGPVLAVEQVPILASDSLDDLRSRMHSAEHRVLVRALQQAICGA